MPVSLRPRQDAFKPLLYRDQVKCLRDGAWVRTLRLLRAGLQTPERQCVQVRPKSKASCKGETDITVPKKKVTFG